ncbi:MAG: aspartate carbamoyltransferase catalytic subunit [Deltaproteobacteria bacterium]|jgi:aspartate carbamoyltransferase catalytic subunit|nr:aspartate carbamoyltransferase catalytic subunit [Deltaproteobacteria bacterium]
MSYEQLQWPKDLLDLDQFSAEHISAILDAAETFGEISQREIKKVPTLRGKLVVLFFHENSTRTRLSFEVAAKRLSADTVALSASGSSMAKGESLLDTARNIEAMNPDALVIRHSSSGAPLFLARHLSFPVLNAGDGAHAHPTQALLDLLTIRQKLGDFKGLKIAIIGDIAHSRVARSNIIGLKTMGAEVVVAGPPSMMAQGLDEEFGIIAYYRPEKAIEGADAIIMLRVQLERQSGSLFPGAREYASVYGLNEERLKLAKKNCLVLHPGPVNQGVEMTPQIYQCPQAVILDQVTNGVAVRMALLFLLIDNTERRLLNQEDRA